MTTITNTMTYIENAGTGVTAGTATQTFTYPIQALASTAAIRLDFQTGVFEQPTSTTGACGGDKVVITQASTGTSGAMNLCGVLTGQHVYLENSGTANMASSVAISISTATTPATRSWKILVTILEVGDASIEGKPSGCLQWFTGETGRITSFNHLNGASQGHMLGVSYTICIRPTAGCVDFRESGGTTDSFRLDGTTGVSTTNSEVGTGTNSCTNTALIIPNIDVAVPFYCGGVLAATDAQSTASPVRSDGHQIRVFSTTTSKANPSSFDLMYQQVDC